MFRDDPYRDAFKAAADATRARIRRDRARAPSILKKVFAVVASRLFDSSLNATEVWRDAGIKDCALRAEFKNSTGVSLSRYIADARVEIAHVLILITDLALASISERLGYNYHPTFTDNYKRLKGKKPSEVERELLAPPLIDDETALKGVRGLLGEDAVVSFMEEMLEIYPTVAGRIRSGACPDPEPLIVVDGAGDDRLKAEGLWQKIRDLPFAEQCRQVRGYCFHTTVFFDLLLENSRREGRKKRQRGIELVKLALISLETSERVFEERIHDLRALGLAWLGNAYRLALDLAAAAAAFEQADLEWSRPRKQRDKSVLASICALKGCLLMVRREYIAATRELDRSCALFRRLGQERDEARELITRARIHTFSDKLSEAVDDLREAEDLIDEDEERELAFAIRGNLANALARAGQIESAAKELGRARELHRTIDDPLGKPKLDWIDGFISERRNDLETAETFYLTVRDTFRDAGELRNFALVSVDLMAVYSMQDDWERIRALASETLPILGSQNLHSETLATVGALAQAAEAGGLSRRLLNELRDCLRQDPLTNL